MSLSKPLVPVGLPSPTNITHSDGFWPNVEWLELNWTITVACGVGLILVLGAGYWYNRKKSATTAQDSTRSQEEITTNLSVVNANVAITEKPPEHELATLHEDRAAVFEDLQEHAFKAAGNVDPKLVDSAVVGNIEGSSPDGTYNARHAALRSEIPIDKPALIINRLCGSGFQSIVNGIHDTTLEDSQVVMTAGGVDKMSEAPIVLRNVRSGTRLGMENKLEDSFWTSLRTSLTDAHAKDATGQTAENLAEKFKITREESDNFALSSQQKWKKLASDAGAFKALKVATGQTAENLAEKSKITREESDNFALSSRQEWFKALRTKMKSQDVVMDMDMDMDKDWIQVIRKCSAFLEVNPRNVEALYQRAKAYKESGLLQDGLEDVMAACMLESSKNKRTKLLLLADVLLQEIGLGEANKFIQTRKPERQPHHIVASFFRSFHNDLFSVIWNQGKVNDSKLTSELTGYQLAVSKLAAHDVDKLIELCTEEINTPGSKFLPHAHLLRGTIRFILQWGFGSEPLEDYNAVISCADATDELKSAAWIKKGVYYSYLPDETYPSKESYVVCFEEAEKLTPSNVDVFYQRGKVFIMNGLLQHRQAESEFEKGSQLAPDFALAPASKLYLQLRVACMTGNDEQIDESIDDFNKCLRKFPNCPDIHGLYGQMLLKIDCLQEAGQQFDKVIALEPNNTTVIVHKAMLQYKITNDAQAALQLLHATCKLDERSELVYETIGTLSSQTRDFDEAAEAFAKAIPLAQTKKEIQILSAMKIAAEVQAKVRAKLGMA